MWRRTSRARSTEASRATRCSATSIPAETPEEVMTSPSSTKRSSPSTRIEASVAASGSRSLQWDVAGRPASSPAAPSTTEPLQTLTSSGTRARWSRSHLRCSASCCSASVRPPGWTRTSSGGASAVEPLGTAVIPFPQRTGPPSRVSRCTRQPSCGWRPHQAASTSHGPAKSSSSTPSNSRIPTWWDASSGPAGRDAGVTRPGSHRRRRRGPRAAARRTAAGHRPSR